MKDIFNWLLCTIIGISFFCIIIGMFAWMGDIQEQNFEYTKETKPIEVTVDSVSFKCGSYGAMYKYKVEIDFNGGKSTLTGYENYSKCSGKIGEKVKAHLNKYTNKKGQSIFQIELD